MKSTSSAPIGSAGQFSLETSSNQQNQCFVNCGRLIPVRIACGSAGG
ncbi:MAG: hypothetical protein H0V31_04970 [Acidobacteria bacterium]|nr:hypothetical protein [Acidobacteriota bacterium]